MMIGVEGVLGGRGYKSRSEGNVAIESTQLESRVKSGCRSRESAMVGYVVEGYQRVGLCDPYRTAPHRSRFKTYSRCGYRRWNPLTGTILTMPQVCNTW